MNPMVAELALLILMVVVLICLDGITRAKSSSDPRTLIRS
jgi:hypothetical protein